MTDAARHELRTPVNQILSYARQVLDEAEALDLDEAIELHLDAIQAAGHQALFLIDAVLERSDPVDWQALLALAEGTTHQAEWLRAVLVSAGHVQAAADVGRIAEAARHLAALITGPDASVLDAGAMNCAPTNDGPAGAQFIAPTGVFAPPTIAPTRGAVRSATLLVVDDNEANRDDLSRSLAGLGYHVLQAEDGRVALDVLASTDVDLVLLDITMPVLDGYAVLEHRRDDPRLRGIPVIVIAATGDDPSVIRCIELGADDYLLRPFHPVLLRVRIGACLERKRLKDQEQQHLATIQAQAAALAAWEQELERRVGGGE